MPDAQPDNRLDPWVEEILRGDARAIARAISAVENREPDAQELLRRLFPHTGRAVVVGVTGSPGTGKSTLVDGLAAALRRRGHTVGILAVDPSSPFSGGAILGDRVRMQSHAADPGIYIRSMATRGALGGLSAGALDAAVVLDAAGKDYILIETVGVGQDEVDVMRIADVTLVLLVPGMGDDVQAFKAGIMEIADIFVLNKADLDGADRVETEIRGMLSLASPDEANQPPILRTVATRQEGVEELLESISRFLAASRSDGRLARRKTEHWRQRLVELVRERVLDRLLGGVFENGDWNRYAAAVASRETDPYSVTDQILKQAGFSGVTPDDRRNPAAVLDHIGIAVASLAEAVTLYERALGLKVAGYEVIPQEQTRVAMIPVGDCRIELMEATDPDSPIARFLAKRGPGLHHISLRVPNLEAAVARLAQNGIKLVKQAKRQDDVVSQTGAGGHRYVFVHPSSAGGVLLELVEQQEVNSE
jgi:LAO/AO transport system kinase